MWIKVIPILVLIAITLAYNSRRSVINSKSNLIIGGLFPVHRKGPNESQPCGEILLEKGIQRLEAMLYAIDIINKNTAKWKLDLGAMALDTCSSDSYALEQSLQFLQLQLHCGPDSSKKRVTGIVGAANSAVSESVANIFRLFKIPQVSYASTSEELDNLHKYPYFFRVVPSDKFQIRAMLDILVYFKWTYVSAVAMEGDYGENAIKSLQDLLNNATSTEICIADVQILPRLPTQEDYENAASSLLQHINVTVVIVFLNEDKIGPLLRAVKNKGAPKNRFLWLGSDGWGAKVNPVRGNEEYAEGAITILPKRFPIEAGFDEYFLSLRPVSNSRNPWFVEFWEHQFSCSFNSSTRSTTACTGEENLKDVYQQEGLVPMVIDSVWLIASAIRSLCQEKPEFCKSGGDKNTKFRKLLKEYIANANINSSQGHDMVIKFDAERNIPTKYKIYQYQRTKKGKFMYKEIGEWTPRNNTRLKMTDVIIWDGKDTVPKSRCSDGCHRGEERIVNRDPKKRCCWTCRECDENKYLPDVEDHCTPCPTGSVSNPYKTGCIELELEYIGRDLQDPWALVPFSFAIFGLVCTSVVFVVFLLYHKTPIIMASGRELCYVILLGVALCYSLTFVVVSKPTTINCGIIRIGMGLGLSICYSAIFTKTNRISRIFNRSFKLAKRPALISPESQLVICSCLILIQIILTVMWLIVSEPKVTNLWYFTRANVLLCAFDGTSVILGLLYNMVLILLCTYYAYKTRNIPENFNESKYISFTMYATCIVWLAFIPIYCSSYQEYKVQATVLCMSVSVSGTITLACMFLPKIYIVLCHPEKNVRYPSSSPNSSTPNISIAAPVRFLRSNQNSPATPHRIPKRICNELDTNDGNFLSVSPSGTSHNMNPNC